MFMNIRTVVAGLFHTDGRTGGQTDMTKQIVANHNLVNAPRNICACDFKFNQNFSNKNVWLSMRHNKVLDDSETYFASVFPNSEIFSWVT